MKPKTIVPLIIGLGVGFFAVKMGIDMVKKAKGTQEETHGVLISAKPIEMATSITETMLTSQKVAVSLVPRDAFTDLKALTGRVSAMPIPAGMPITKSMLAPPGAEPGLRAMIPAGHRAVSVSVTEESAVAGFITPGSRVDVSVVYAGRAQASSGKFQVNSKVILTNVEVGAVGQSLSQAAPDGKGSKISKSVTLFLKPDQVETLNASVGVGKGKIRLALRGNSTDPTESMFAKLLKDALETKQEEAPKPIKLAGGPHVAKQMVEVHRGTAMERLIFDPTGHCVKIAGDQPLPKEPEARAENPQQAAPAFPSDFETDEPTAREFSE